MKEIPYGHEKVYAAIEAAIGSVATLEPESTADEAELASTGSSWHQSGSNRGAFGTPFAAAGSGSGRSSERSTPFG